MKQFATIVFVLIFALAGKSQSQDFSHNIAGCTCVKFTNGSPSSQNPIIFEDFFYDGQDTNDIYGFDAVSVLPVLYHFFQHFEISGYEAATQSHQNIQIGELLLDLPPPLLTF
ncbi:MAG TPA: hypothetical protein P5210_07030 [Draconibacterium sp.]|nr:hypothetical protein [Draconibacterium sp.]